MSSRALILARQGPSRWRDYVTLTKPRVMALVVFTGLCGLLAAPVSADPLVGLTAIFCIAIAGGAAGALNQWYEADLDALMKRTANRPLPACRLSRRAALQFGIALGSFAVLLMGVATNWLAGAILALSILFYIFVYTIWLKRRTPNNIVIGGAAGAFPPMIGWIAATGGIGPMPLLLFAIIFLWTPAHFWSLSLFVSSDYAAAGVPMLPVVAGPRATRRQIAAYAFAMSIAAVAPWSLGLAGVAYGATAMLLSGVFMTLALRVLANNATAPARMKPEKRLFAFSIFYLFILFGALVVDRWIA